MRGSPHDASQVVTYTPDGVTPTWLGTLGNVTGLTWDFQCPGGASQMSCTLQRPSRYRNRALDPGRPVAVVRGGSRVWQGKLDEPDPTSGVWQVSAHGSGTLGNDYMAQYTGSWTANPDAAVNAAISRGLDWVNPGIGSPAGIWLGQKVDPASQSVTDLLNLCCTKGSLTWYVDCRAENQLSVFALSSVPVSALLLVSGAQLRSLYGDINVVWERYQSVGDSGNGGTAIFATTSTVEQSSIDAHGRMETYADLSSAGTLTAGAAQQVGRNVLDRYGRANWGNTFAVWPGQLLTLGGQPIDLAMVQAGFRVRVILMDEGYGGELTPTPIQFLVGAYSYDETSRQGQVTAFQSVRYDMATLLGLAVPAPRPGPSGGSGGGHKVHPAAR